MNAAHAIYLANAVCFVLIANAAARERSDALFIASLLGAYLFTFLTLWEHAQ